MHCRQRQRLHSELEEEQFNHQKNSELKSTQHSWYLTWCDFDRLKLVDYCAAWRMYLMWNLLRFADFLRAQKHWDCKSFFYRSINYACVFQCFSWFTWTIEIVQADNLQTLAEFIFFTFLHTRKWKSMQELLVEFFFEWRCH